MQKMARIGGAEVGEVREEITLASVSRPDYARTLDERVMAAIAPQIKAVGLLEPLLVGPYNGLLDGYHRLRVLRRLGWLHVWVERLDAAQVEARLFDLDSELGSLLAVDAALHDHLAIARLMARRREHYEALYPTTFRNEPGVRVPIRSRMFRTATLERFAMARGAYDNWVLIGAKLAPEIRDLLRGTPVASSRRALSEIAARPREEQLGAAQSAIARREAHEDDERPLASDADAREVEEAACHTTAMRQSSVDRAAEASRSRALEARAAPIAPVRMRRWERAFVLMGRTLREMDRAGSKQSARRRWSPEEMQEYLTLAREVQTHMQEWEVVLCPQQRSQSRARGT